MSKPTAGPSLPFLLMIAGTAALGGFLFGFDTAVINGAVIALETTFNATPWVIGLSVSLALLGSAVGAFAAGPLADRYGRIRCMVTASVLFTISALGSGLPVTIWDFILWRIVGGMAVGAASVIAPAYIAEVSPAHLRGRLGSLQQLAIVIGIFISLLSNFAIARAAGSAEAPFWFGFTAWKWMFWMEMIPAVVYGLAAMRIPESPRYLVARGRIDEARTVLVRVLGGDVDHKIEEIRQSLRSDTPPSFRDLRGKLGLLPVVWIGIGLSAFQQFVGINVIFYYGSALWRAVGFSEHHALALNVVTGLTNILTTLVAIATVDRFGRRPLLLIGSLGMAVTLGTMATVFAGAPLDAAGSPVLEGNAAWAALIAANLYIFFFGASWGPVVWVLLGEMFNNRIRAAALAVAASAQWVANFIVSTTFPPLSKGLGLGAAYAFYTACAALSFVFVLTLVKETKGRELEQME
ncbi:MAG TPA: sugar porter family MFS transporter [Kiritimatiellia bacterium]|nr:sugar porter family MFS transporter [Kiritimatiellia bacterium]HMP33715.1 sugar porter family MFS transporter [Kiritimatiellia bacterium]